MLVRREPETALGAVVPLLLRRPVRLRDLDEHMEPESVSSNLPDEGTRRGSRRKQYWQSLESWGMRVEATVSPCQSPRLERMM
jgi:hypothetical protein